MKEFTLPVWVAAAAKAATNTLIGNKIKDIETIILLDNKKSLSVPIASSALLDNGDRALAISFCQSGLSLDITSGLEIWAYVQLIQKRSDNYIKKEADFPNWIDFYGGFGIGKFESSGQTCISLFARELLCLNLYPLVPDGFSLKLEIVFPKGKSLALRTSNQAFGVVDGLSLIGTQAEVQISASPDQLRKSIKALQRKCAESTFDGSLTFVIGENGMDLAQKFGLPPNKIIKIGNWVGPLLVQAAQNGVKKLLLFGYHGKLVKLAGGVFHTHHHLADGRLEILTSIAVKEGIPFDLIQLISQSTSVENAMLALDSNHSQVLLSVWGRMADDIENKSMDYINRYMSSSIEIGSVLFDRKRQVRWAGFKGLNQLNSLGLMLK